jgi:hypothetical protein
MTEDRGHTEGEKVRGWEGGQLRRYEARRPGGLKAEVKRMKVRRWRK